MAPGGAAGSSATAPGKTAPNADATGATTTYTTGVDAGAAGDTASGAR
jgi:hypothetical protein